MRTRAVSGGMRGSNGGVDTKLTVTLIAGVNSYVWRRLLADGTDR